MSYEKDLKIQMAVFAMEKLSSDLAKDGRWGENIKRKARQQIEYVLAMIKAESDVPDGNGDDEPVEEEEEDLLKETP